MTDKESLGVQDPVVHEGIKPVLTSQPSFSMRPVGSTSLTPLSAAGLCDAVITMPVSWPVFKARAPISRPHLRVLRASVGSKRARAVAFLLPHCRIQRIVLAGARGKRGERGTPEHGRREELCL